MILLSGLATTFEVIYLYIITKRPAVVINLDFVDKSAKIWSKVVQNFEFYYIDDIKIKNAIRP